MKKCKIVENLKVHYFDISLIIKHLMIVRESKHLSIYAFFKAAKYNKFIILKNSI